MRTHAAQVREVAEDEAAGDDLDDGLDGEEDGGDLGGNAQHAHRVVERVIGGKDGRRSGDEHQNETLEDGGLDSGDAQAPDGRSEVEEEERTVSVELRIRPLRLNHNFPTFATKDGDLYQLRFSSARGRLAKEGKLNTAPWIPYQLTADIFPVSVEQSISAIHSTQQIPGPYDSCGKFIE